jgi:[protein-PII] uridylyltransferase
MPASYPLAFDVDVMERHEALLADAPVVRCKPVEDGVEVTVIAPDRPGLLATLAGALTLCGVDVLEANLFGTVDGLALDVFRGADPYQRVDEDGSQVIEAVNDALAGEIDVAARVEERRRAYARDTTPTEPIIEVNAQESETDTVVEIHADDDVGLLYRLASAFAELSIDVRVAKVGTDGTRAVDVFYVRDTAGSKITDLDEIERLRAALIARLSR